VNKLIANIFSNGIIINKIILILYLFISLETFAKVDTIPPLTPQNVKAFGYENHIDLCWWNNEESDLAGYKVYRKVSGQFYFYTNVSKEKSYLMLSNLGLNNTQTFKVSAYDSSGNESPLSDSVVATTHIMTDEEFLDMTQRATFRYFWDYAHPVSGLARERLGSGETVTTGGSGFGIMALLVGVERGFTSRELAKKRMLKILNFLTNKAQRFRGAFPHWLNGTTGQVIPFSQYDDGGDLVETSFLIQGLLAARQYFNGTDSMEIQIRNLITNIWETVEWNWYRRSPYSNYLYWHWSPNYGWQMNFKLIGYNETMITYLLAIASPTHSVPANLYYNGWASSSGYFINQTYYGYKLWVGEPYGGPLFFAHYSFLGFDPRNKRDNYCNYFINNRHHTLINRAYCIANPLNHFGYNENTWGITASDSPWGYLAHQPFIHDNGTIAPTAAISSMPYTPQESISALKNFYRSYYVGLWGEYGFKDAFNIGANWFANSYLAIDQGPIIVMIENYRSQLLWNKFMANPEIQPMLDAIGFIPDTTTTVEDINYSPDGFQLYQNYPNPFNPGTTISWQSPVGSRQIIKLYNSLGEEIDTIVDGYFEAGKHSTLYIINSSLPSGVYFYQLKSGDFIQNRKMILMK
jgi:hypothetical protein